MFPCIGFIRNRKIVTVLNPEVRPQFFPFFNLFAFSSRLNYGILVPLLGLPEYSKGGEADMEGIYTSFLLSILASVIAYYICKWLDKQQKQ